MMAAADGTFSIQPAVAGLRALPARLPLGCCFLVSSSLLRSTVYARQPWARMNRGTPVNASFGFKSKGSNGVAVTLDFGSDHLSELARGAANVLQAQG